MGLTQKLRHLKYRLKYRYGKNLPLTAPVDVSLELSSHCNQRCVYCYHADKASLPFEPAFMNTEMARKIIRESAEIGVNSIKFNYRGESTLHPNFAELTGYAKSLARGSTFIDRLTNSNFKFPNGRDDIFEGLCNQTKVKVSFDSFRKEIFEEQRAGGIYELAIGNVDKFYNHPLRRDTELVIQAVRTARNADEDLEGFVRNRWPSATASIRDVVVGRVERDLSNYTTRERSSERQSCLQAHVRLIYGGDGWAQVCCPDIGGKLRVGHADVMSVKDIFNSYEAYKIRQNLKSGHAFGSDPCKTCSSYESYKGFKPNWES